MTRRICITGPEATGKSSIAQALAEYYGCSWVPEYARSYLTGLERPYRRDDLERILQGQLSSEISEAAKTGGPYLFCDTGPEVIWVWSQFKYGEASASIDLITQKHTYDLTLLMDIDLPWAPDPLRENPSRKDRFNLFDRYRRLLDRLDRDYRVISGRNEARLLNAVRVVDESVRAH